mgnify:FL=1
MSLFMSDKKDTRYPASVAALCFRLIKCYGKVINLTDAMVDSVHENVTSSLPKYAVGPTQLR